MSLRALLVVIAAGLVSAAATCESLTPKDYARFDSTAGLVVGEGDPEQGRADFVAFRCHQCHTVGSVTFEPAPSPLAEPIALGGPVAELPTDGYLATAIIQPDHDLAEGYPREIVTVSGRSRMADYSDLITIRQLRDLVAFLHRYYRVAER
jgi:hypothetical protein